MTARAAARNATHGAAAYLRFPHLHGELLTFVAEDDVWIAPLDGGRAWRLSADRAPAANPRFSPDGNRIAWTSRRDGVPEVHAAEIETGAGGRLTYWGSATTRTCTWTPGGDVVAASAAGEPSSRRSWAHAVPPGGGPASRLPYGPVGDVGYGPQGQLLVTTPVIREPAWWKRYRGGTVARLWFDADGGGSFERRAADIDGQLASPMWVAGRIAFLSDHEGWGNVYSIAPDGSDLRRHSDHGAGPEDAYYARHASTDGERIVYQCGGRLWLLDGLDAAAQPRPLPVRLAGPRAARAPQPVRAADHLGDVAPDTTGRASAVEVHGTVHWLPHRDGPARALADTPGTRTRLPRPLGDTGQVAWISDAEGDDAVEIGDGVELGGQGGVRRLASGRIGRVLDLVASPDGRLLALCTHDGRLLLLAAGTGELREVANSPYGEPRDPSFSPDSAWLAWSAPGPAPLRRIRLAHLDDLAAHDVTQLRFVDTGPVFTRDGAHLAFLSERSFDPVYEAHSFDLAFPAGSRPQLVPLTARTGVPFGPRPGGRPVEPDRPVADAVSTDVELHGLDQRVVPLPVPEGRYGALRPVTGGLVWLRRPGGGVLGDGRARPDDDPPRPVLERFDLDRGRCDVLADSADAVEVSGDGNRLVVRDGAELHVLPADKAAEIPAEDRVDVDLDRIRVSTRPGEQWRQMYDETGRLMRDHFWRADLAEVDWDGVLARYRPLVDAIATHDDLTDLLWEVNGELGTSHAYARPAEGGPDPALRQGLLGADLAPDVEGTWRVVRVLPGESSDPRARSPLAAPGVDIRAGAALLAVGGRPVEPLTGPAPLLAGTAGKPVELTVADGDSRRQVVVVPLSDEERLRYQDEVARRRAEVLTGSGGRVGYLHLPDMMAVGWAQLHRDLRVETDREALIVDVRENRGGHTSPLVSAKLAQRVLGWAQVRHRTARRYPAEAVRGPVVAVADEFSGSDGDIITAMVQAMGIGPVVGVRTWGGVIGIDSRYQLVDGTVVTQPRYAHWFSGFGWGIENHGVAPDVEVPTAPQDWAAGRDPQLDTAVRLALQALADRPAATPPDPGEAPSRRIPVLPPRTGQIHP